MNAERGHTVLAALNHTPAVQGVLTTALGLADMLEAEVEALHVSEGSRSARMARGATKAAGVHLVRGLGRSQRRSSTHCRARTWSER